MTGDFPSFSQPQHPGLSFVRVTTDEDVLAYADLISRAYGMPLDAGRDELSGSELWKSGVYTYRGLQNGLPVSAASVVPTNNCLFLALVATAPEMQRKGFAEATAHKALFEGARATGLT